MRQKQSKAHKTSECATRPVNATLACTASPSATRRWPAEASSLCQRRKSQSLSAAMLLLAGASLFTQTNLGRVFNRFDVAKRCKRWRTLSDKRNSPFRRETCHSRLPPIERPARSGRLRATHVMRETPRWRKELLPWNCTVNESGSRYDTRHRNPCGNGTILH